MALHYSNNNSNNDSETKAYSNPVPVQKTPFSIEDILYQRNNSGAVKLISGGKDTSQMLIQRSDFVINQKPSEFNGEGGGGGGGDAKKLHPSERFQMNKSSHSFPATTTSQAAPPPPHSSGHAGLYSYPSGPTYSDGYLHMIAPYLASTATGYKSVDPYFLSQGKYTGSRNEGRD